MAATQASYGRFTILRWLTKDQTALAIDDSGRQVVLKILDQDCLLKGKLHPNIRDRLERVRELAHPGVANLHGVERLTGSTGSPQAGKTYLVWEFVPGKTFEEHARGLDSEKELSELGREMELAVRSMHGLGIVHGAIHGRNFIIDNLGKVRLTHVSPLLYDEPENDSHDLSQMVREAARRKGWEDQAQENTIQMKTDEGERQLRKKMTVAALLLCVAGAALTGILWGFLHTTTPSPLVPPEAPGNVAGQ